MTKLHVTEKEFEAYVVDVATRGNWVSWHVPMPGRHIGDGRIVPDPRGAGLPDRVFLHEDPPRLVLAELKGSAGHLRAEQRVFLRMAKAVAGEVREAYQDALDHRESEVPIGVYTWRPGDEEMIEAVLIGKVMVA